MVAWIILAALGGGGLGYYIWSAIEGWAALRWPVVEGEITSSKMEQVPGDRWGPYYSPSVAYSYRVLGTTYSGTRVRFGLAPNEFSPVSALAKVAQYPVGTTVQ